MKDKVIYRKYSDGEVIALFTQIPAGCLSGRDCISYLHVGQHGAATPFVVVRQTKLATPADYRALHAELKQIGYDPQPAKKFTPKDLKIRRAEIERMRK